MPTTGSPNAPACELLTLPEAARLLPTRPHASALWRWSRLGLRARDGTRVRLKHLRLGGRIYTTHADLDAFGRALADADSVAFDEAVDAVRAAPIARSRTRGGRTEERD